MPTRRDIFRKIANASAERKATCGACGTERVVPSSMRRDYYSQYTRRPDAPTDLFYCGCQNDDEYY